MSSSGLFQFRIFAALFHWTILVVRFGEDERLPPLCYLTNIVYLCCALYYSVAVYNGMTRAVDSLPLYHKLDAQVFRMDKLCYEKITNNNNVHISYVIQWLLHSIVLNMSILVSLMYFILIYNPAKDVLGMTNVSRHILNSVFICIEFCLNTIPVRFFHVIYGLLLAVIYALYTFLFWYFVRPPGNYIYMIVDWNKPGKTCQLILMLMCAAVVLKLLLMLASRVKFRLINPSNDKSSHSQSFLV